jgi:hypothetical protein
MIFSCPDGYLTRAEVFEQAFARLTAGCLDELRLDATITCTVHDDGETFTPNADEADRRFANLDAYNAYRWRVARLLGDAVADGRLPPYIRASNGQMERARRDNPEEWRREFDNFADEISSLWPDAGDQPVFWKESDLQALLSTLDPFGTVVAKVRSFQPTIADPRSRDEVLADYFKTKHEAGEHPKQDEARKVLAAAGKTWDRESFRERFNQLARNRGLRVGKGLR